MGVRWGDMYRTLPYCNLWVQWNLMGLDWGYPMASWSMNTTLDWRGTLETRQAHMARSPKTCCCLSHLFLVRPTFCFLQKITLCWWNPDVCQIRMLWPKKKLHIRSLPVVTAVEEVDPDHLCALRQQQRYKGGARRFFVTKISDGQKPGRRVRATHQ